ncbi:hypothetical protein G7085_05780 [Tessaracoccus sp. HDW20]|uniref:hypothetical protein n=1 Tax=Tessaracoccus coleopterorum TaxID=2714950 RepID=UPI0018D32D1F|nr:hypothetical protein [Tessaracoccus coleopterorum]NHB84286.1 hypothetical protein [Tessaracoccus coleopterorum]
MPTPQLHAIGFDAATVDEIIHAAFEAGVRGAQVPGYSLIGTYTDPSGARLAFVQREGSRSPPPAPCARRRATAPRSCDSPMSSPV